ncbi:hypothetical protein B0A54_02984 [Friedmanniomyces endolithicus]|uniref:Initiator tRNA phosphoribosyl transferase n=1 Tax=Friedmanniomyces endolithicus TaxID=329885 RepID=A0A4U0VB78_9PEZI|nr:hypothetical protein B0A54_02984 [Friedmanniomyces endolithicus]
MPRPLQESDLIFAPAASSLKTALGELKRSHLSITNRLQSIQQDADFVLGVSRAYDLPLVANERCGSWYIPPERKAGSAYFKSTDGHFGEWAFSLRRLNLQVLDVLGQYGGVSNYVQGAADDSESWALGLGPALFWANNALLMTAPESELPALIEEIVAESVKVTSMRLPTQVKPAASLWIANNASAEKVYADFDIVICCSVTVNAMLTTVLKTSYVHLACSNGKNGSRQLRTELPKLRLLASKISQSSRILVTCETGKDLAVGVALAILCTLYSSDGRLRLGSTDEVPDFVSKPLIKHRLSWIMVCMPDAAPSRATLQSVNAYLMG